MSKRSSNEWQATLTGEILLLSFLGRMIYTFPEEDEQAWLTSLFEEGVFLDVPFAADQEGVDTGLELLREWGKGGVNDKKIERLQTDYTRLFIGPGKIIAPPWESVYIGQERMIFQEQTLIVRNWYRRFGLESEKLHNEPDDHIGLEIIFVSHLAKMALQALEEEKEDDFQELITAQREFFSDHLIKWGPRWCRLVLENAQTDFYKGLALLTRGALLAIAAEHEISVSQEFVDEPALGN